MHRMGCKRKRMWPIDKKRQLIVVFRSHIGRCSKAKNLEESLIKIIVKKIV